jgi:2'-phosphotransferase
MARRTAANGTEPEQPSATEAETEAAAEELARLQAQADEAMRALLAEEDALARPRKGKRGKGVAASASAQRPALSGQQRQVKFSKAMSYLLRHGAADAGLEMRPDGYVELRALLEHKSLRGCAVDEAIAIVSSNDKQRFSLQADSATGIQWIRANQGHTLSTVKDSELLVEITDPKDVPVCVHGTYARVLPLILWGGLSRMARNHIHFAVGLPSTKGDVISGMRGNCEVAVYLDVPAALQSGIKLYRSENGVLLSPGDASGSIQPGLLTKVVDLRTGKNLLPQAQETAGDGSSATAAASAAPRKLTAEKETHPAQLNEVVGDLFANSYDAGDGICHCVSEDMHMGAGIAREFKKRYGRVADLLAQNTKTGGCAQIQADNQCWIYYLVTKVRLLVHCCLHVRPSSKSRVCLFLCPASGFDPGCDTR